jgi:hypothetical protein
VGRTLKFHPPDSLDAETWIGHCGGYRVMSGRGKLWKTNTLVVSQGKRRTDEVSPWWWGLPVASSLVE